MYIYIRSGDIFVRPHSKYFQPPLCFYSSILNNFEFKRIFLISENKNNPVISELLNIYPFIIYSRNPLKLDISYLINAYNLAGGEVSTFFSHIMALNYNSKVLFYFKFQIAPTNLSSKFNIKTFYNHHFKKIFIMYASKNYLLKMKPWKNKIEQRKLMITSNCSKHYNFNIIFNNI